MNAKMLPEARADTDTPARACGQPSHHDESGHCDGHTNDDKQGNEPGESAASGLVAQMTAAVFESAIKNGKRLSHLCDTRCQTNCPLPADRAHSSRVFPCTADHVSVVRAFTRKRLAGHPARDDAVLVISELAANSTAYSDGPWLLVHVTEVSATHAAVLITEWRGSGAPAVIDADADSESGRGLAIVRLLSCFVHIGEQGNARNILAIVPADQPTAEAKRRRARSARRPARRTARRDTT